MSVDYYLVSKSRRRCAQVGSVGFGGVQSYPGTQEVVDFIRWAIEEAVSDVQMVDEDELDAFCDEVEIDYVDLREGRASTKDSQE